MILNYTFISLIASVYTSRFQWRSVLRALESWAPDCSDQGMLAIFFQVWFHFLLSGRAGPLVHIDVLSHHLVGKKANKVNMDLRTGKYVCLQSIVSHFRLAWNKTCQS